MFPWPPQLVKIYSRSYNLKLMFDSPKYEIGCIHLTLFLIPGPSRFDGLGNDTVPVR